MTISFEPKNFDLGFGENMHELFRRFDHAITQREECSEAVLKAFCDLIRSDIWMIAVVHFTELIGATGDNAMRCKIIQGTRLYRTKLYCLTREKSYSNYSDMPRRIEELSLELSSQ